MTEALSLMSLAPWVMPETFTLLNNADINHSIMPHTEAVPPKYVTDPAEWDAVRGLLKQLYVIEGKELKEVMCIMQSHHHFNGTPQQYKKRFRKWNFRKYNCEEDVRDLLSAESRRPGVKLPYRTTKSGRQVNMASVRRYARRKGLHALNNLPNDTTLDKYRQPSITSPQSISQITLVKSPLQQLEIVLRAVDGYICGGFDAGIWYSDGSDLYVVSSKEDEYMFSAGNFPLEPAYDDIQCAYEALKCDDIITGFTIVSHLCHNVKIMLQIEEFHMIHCLLVAADRFATLDILLARKVMKYICSLSQIIHGHQHPLSIITRYLASEATPINDRGWLQCIRVQLFRATQKTLGHLHLDTVQMYDSTGLPDEHIQNLMRESLAACDAYYGSTCSQSRRCLSQLAYNATDAQELRAVVSEMQVRTSLENNPSKFSPWSILTDVYELRLAVMEKQWGQAEIILRDKLIPYSDERSSRTSRTDRITDRVDLIKILKWQDKWEEIAEVQREIDEITASISEEIRVE